MTVGYRLLAVVPMAAFALGVAVSPAMARDDSASTNAAPTVAVPAAVPAAAPANSAAVGSAGMWQAHKYTFDFMGFTTTYTCDGLADKLRLLLRMVGAEPGFKVNESCSRGFNRPDKLAAAYLTFASLQPQASATVDASKPPDPATSGTWQHVEFAPNHPFDLGRGDCELIEQFRDRVLPLFTVRNVVNNVSCIPYQDVGSDFHLSFDVFAPVKPPG